MKPGEKISVLLAVHNGRPFIVEAIESLIAQTYENWELVIVSNGSTDATVSLCEELARSEPRVRVFAIAERNKNAAYNFAYNKSTGGYVCFFAADDILPPDSLSERIGVLAGAGPESFSTCCLKTVSADPKYHGVVFPKNISSPNYSGGSLFFSREAADRIFPLPEGQPNEDTWASLHLRAFGTNRHIRKPLYLYRIHDRNSYGYGLDFNEKRSRYLHRMNAYKLFHDKYGTQRLRFIEREVVPFLNGLRAANDKSVLRILFAPGLSASSKFVLIFYCSKSLYNIRHAFFRVLSGGMAR